MTSRPNARLTLFANGETVKLTLHPGQSLAWEYSRQEDEGYSAGGFQVSLEQKTGLVVLQEWSEGRDCDGRSSWDSVLECHVMRLRSVNNGFNKPAPDWKELDSSRRDYSAERAGY